MVRIVVVVALALACSALGTGSAAAHTALAGSDPAEGTTVKAVPGVVTLTFTEDIDPAFATVVVSGSDGRDRVTGAAQVTGPRLRVSLRSDGPVGGDYTVGYRVVSADGHPVSGSFVFTVATSPASSAVVSSTISAPPAEAPSESGGPLGSDTKTSVLTAGAAGLLLGAAIAFWQSRRRKRKGPGDDEPS